MFFWDAILQLAVALILLREVTTQFVTVPSNTVALEGDRVRFGCMTNLTGPLEWEFAPTGSRNFRYIYVSGRVPPYVSSTYKIDRSTAGQFDIIIESVDFTVAGTYRCNIVVDLGKEGASSASARLITIASNPVCGTNASADGRQVVEHDFIRMYCAVNNSGNWIPSMEWSNGQEKSFEISNITNSSTTATSSLLVQLNFNDNGVTFSCKTSFKPENTHATKKGDVHAINTPPYKYTWTYTANVLYGPRNLTIEPRNLTSAVGNKLRCLADGNPTPNYEWIVSVDNQVVISRSSHEIYWMDLESDLQRYEVNVTCKMLSLTCTAFNLIAGERKEISGNITIPAGFNWPDTDKKTIIKDHTWSVVLCVAVVVLATITVVVYFSRKGRCLCWNRKSPDIVFHSPANDNELYDNSKIFPVYAEVRKENSSKNIHSSRSTFEENDTLHPVLQSKTIVDRENHSSNGQCSAAVNHHLAEGSIAINAEANMERNEPKLSEKPFLHPRERTPKNYVGEDGTQYMDINSHWKPSHVQRPNLRPPMFHQVETYASIDHTLRTPLPPPRDFF